MRLTWNRAAQRFPKAIRKLCDPGDSGRTREEEKDYRMRSGDLVVREDGVFLWKDLTGSDDHLEWSEKYGDWFFEGEVELTTGGMDPKEWRRLGR